MFSTHWLHKMCTMVANHSLHCATNLKNHHTWSRKRYIKLDAWNAWQKDDILLCCMMFQSRWLHKMCHRGSQSYFALCYQLEEPPHLVKKKVTLSLTLETLDKNMTSCFVAWCFKVAGFTRCATVVANHSLHCATNLKNHHTWSRKGTSSLTLETLDKKMTSCFVAWCFKVAGFTRCATVVANHSLHCATNLKNHHTWSRKRYIKLDAWNAWQKDDILLWCMMFQSRWLHKMCHRGGQS